MVTERLTLKLSLKVEKSSSLSPWLYGTKEWSQWPGLNRRPTVYETVALPLSYIGTKRCLSVTCNQISRFPI